MSDAHVDGTGSRRRRGGGGRAERSMVPDATFTSYYGRPVLKPPAWEERDIAGYLFLGGLAAGSSLLAAGADVAALPTLRRSARVTAAGAVTLSLAALVHDLGRPQRFVNMLRVAKPTSPMSVGTWILSAYSLPVMTAAAAELAPGSVRRVLRAVSRPAGLAAAAIAPAVASYTAVLVADTAVPTWNGAYPELPFVFCGSAAAAAAGMALVTVPSAQTTPVRVAGVLGAGMELAAMARAEQRMGLAAEPLSTGDAGRMLTASRWLTASGALVAAVGAGRSRTAGVAAGAALLAGSVLTRFGIFRAGVASTKDPRYVVVPQRERLEREQDRRTG